ncbi:PUR family DNA/RNA-binding protein [Olleya sp. R77988]|uniref:PUR family DNA/RNA-binding protein n=1 Tax=Olleya sp. R77988 TaxID=3093875 RepID=UPI0037CB912E
MYNNEMMEKEEIFSKVLRAGRRTYFFDVRATKANDYYLTITESKKFTNDDGSFHYKKHKIYLYKEDFNEFNEILKEMTDYIIAEKGDEVISERHQKDFKKEYDTPPVSTPKTETTETVAPEATTDDASTAESRFTDVDFDDI